LLTAGCARGPGGAPHSGAGLPGRGSGGHGRGFGFESVPGGGVALCQYGAGLFVFSTGPHSSHNARGGTYMKKLLLKSFVYWGWGCTRARAQPPLLSRPYAPTPLGPRHRSQWAERPTPSGGAKAVPFAFYKKALGGLAHMRGLVCSSMALRVRGRLGRFRRASPECFSTKPPLG
jgi:hypothetical protein